MKQSVLYNYGLKDTNSRREVLHVLEKSDHPLTSHEIFKKLKKKDIDLSTIYRTLNLFEKVSLAKKETNEKKENVYSLATSSDKHILVCTVCHKRVPLDGCPYHEVNQQISQKTGFLIQDQNTEIYGICPDCQKKKNQ